MSPLERLREGTRALHAALDHAPRLTQLLSPTLQRSVYAATLGHFYGIVVPLERRLARALEAESDAPHEVEAWRALTSRAAALAEDLAELGVDAVALPQVDECDLPVLDSIDAALGCAYVQGGSSLGGQVIARHVARHLGLTPERGLRYFAGPELAVRPAWSALLATVKRTCATPASTDAAVAAAQATFHTYLQWME